ncbi:MAG TPA: CHASE3 domain-containing protein, partial [Flavisolibacter sp.]
MTFSNKLAKIVFATATCVVFALSFLLYKRVLHLDDSYREVNQNNLVKLKLEQILSTLKDAESAQRGYLLTKDSLFLEPYFGGYDRISRLMTEVRALTEKNAVQQKNLDALTTFIEVRFRAFRTQIDQF